MAKTGFLDSDPTAISKAKELKREMKKLLSNIVEEEDDGLSVQTIDQLQEALSAFRHATMRKMAKSSSLEMLETAAVSCPDEFRCPLSNELMRDPVVLASGQTYDKLFIQKWLSSGNRTCPKTQQVLPHTALTPNVLIRDMISKWCKTVGLETKNLYESEEAVTRSDREVFDSLLCKVSSTNSQDQRSAAKELRLLTKKGTEFRALFGESSEGITRLVSPLLLHGSSLNQDEHRLQEDVVTTLLNISIHDDSNKKLVCENPNVIPLLIDALKRGTVATRSNAAAAIFTLSALDLNKVLIGKSGILKPLIDLLEEGNPLAIKDVAAAIFTLCIAHENRSRAVKDGAIKVLGKKISDGLYVDELLAILAMLVTHWKAVEELGELGGVSWLLKITRESECKRNKENAIVILHTICFSDRTKWKEIREEESSHGTITRLAREGTSRAQRKANGILDRLRKAMNLTHTA
ncbi:U-box domain-containing protein 9 [Raphanus sativus]|uniref:RING-type E3 ubiquitin transferase n=1 Tax=Raphanus sativus TaxID=3726 RepID=A0A9W3DU86_RAPSA|nr:U-box domain-containing protein 9 [Raphanus sativus]XP_056867365.1 U-box domain-containing protein 9 [Raphanus sativus]XP_056867366.1 U-box domain-containing protein 9 [Raphanus sativus]KAJ4898373.1 U-box domain-containing protein 9 [Raphanus sativus]